MSLIERGRGQFELYPETSGNRGYLVRGIGQMQPKETACGVRDPVLKP